MLCLSILCGVGQVACGQKGPPLAPIVYLPRPVTELAVKRVEGDIVVQFKLPTANTDGTAPADLDRVEVYAHTGPLPAPADFLKYGTLVESVKVKPPPEPTAETEGQRSEGKGQRSEGKGQRSEGKGQSGEPSPMGTKEPVQSAAKPGAATDYQLPATSSLVEQGWAITVRETLNAKHMEIGPMPPARAIVPVPGAAPVETLETPGTMNFPLPLARHYTAVGVSRSRGRRGPYAGPLRVPLVEPLAPVGEVTTSYTPDAVVLTWPGQPEDLAVIAPAAPGAAPAATATVPVAAAAPVIAADSEPVADPNQETPGTYEIYAAIETEGTVDAPLAAAAVAAPSRPQPPSTPRFGYNVYEISASAPPLQPDKPDASPSAAPPLRRDEPAPHVPLNTALLTTPSFKDPRVEFGIERCYVVRRVEMASGIAIESAPSPAACVTLVDTFPPPPPASLAHVASGTEVSLIWETSTAADLAGYLVLRGEAPGDKLAPLTAAPISDASYVDTSVRRNRTYVYEVVAVDKSGNQSAPSNRVEETIR